MYVCMYACVHVCMCVCVCEQQVERWGAALEEELRTLRVTIKARRAYACHYLFSMCVFLYVRNVLFCSTSPC